MKRKVLHFMFGSFILPQTPAALVRCSRGWWVGTRALSSPKHRSKTRVRFCCCHCLCPVRSPWMAPASPFQSAPPVLAKFCPEKHHDRDAPWAVFTLWIAQFSQNLSAGSSQKRQGDPGRCPQLWCGWWCLLHALHTDNLDKIPSISWFSLE